MAGSGKRTYIQDIEHRVALGDTVAEARAAVDAARRQETRRLVACLIPWTGVSCGAATVPTR